MAITHDDQDAPLSPGLWIRATDAARMLLTHETTIKRLASEGHIRVYRLPGGRPRYSRDDIIRLRRQAEAGAR